MSYGSELQQSMWQTRIGMNQHFGGVSVIQEWTQLSKLGESGSTFYVRIIGQLVYQETDNSSNISFENLSLVSITWYELNWHELVGPVTPSLNWSCAQSSVTSRGPSSYRHNKIGRIVLELHLLLVLPLRLRSFVPAPAAAAWRCEISRLVARPHHVLSRKRASLLMGARACS